MSFTTALVAFFITLFCIAAAAVLLRLFYLVNATATPAETETLLTEFKRDTRVRRRARAGPTGHAGLANFPVFTSLSATRIRFPSD